MASSSRLANKISFVASVFHFILIMFQIPLFRAPCRSGTCTSPVEVTASQLIATEVMPIAFVKALLYPGAVANAVIMRTSIPSFNTLLDLYDLNNVKEASASTDIRHLEIVTGSYLSVGGAILGLLSRGRTSLFSMLLLLWGLVKEATWQSSRSTDDTNSVKIYPTILISILVATLSVKADVRKIIRSFPAKKVTKTGKRTPKSKCM
ncbi:hypothetical protein Droror1_Dr00010004 [Drosera rotundifolia]